MFHTIWMLHKAKKKKNSEISVNIVPTCYQQVTNILPTHHRLSADCRLSVVQLSTDKRPTVDWQSTNWFFGKLFFTVTKLRIHPKETELQSPHTMVSSDCNPEQLKKGHITPYFGTNFSTYITNQKQLTNILVITDNGKSYCWKAYLELKSVVLF